FGESIQQEIDTFSPDHLTAEEEGHFASQFVPWLGEERVELAAIRQTNALGLGETRRVVALGPCANRCDTGGAVERGGQTIMPPAPGRAEPLSHEDPRPIAKLKP